MKNLILLFASMLLITACAQEEFTKKAKNKPSPVVSGESKPSSDSGDVSEVEEEKSCEKLIQVRENEDAIEKHDELHIERHYQMVKRTDCDGSVVSEKIEEVKAPKENYIIKATDIPIYKRVNTSAAVVRGSCMYTQNGNLSSLLGRALSPSRWFIKRQIEFTADIANAVFTTQVKEGENIIDYVFYDDACTYERQADGLCDEVKPLEMGTLYLTVTYEKKHLEGVKEISNCREEDKPRSENE